jgi:hypothetical protein
MLDLHSETVMDVKGVAAKFLVSQVTVYRWFDRGLEHFKVGGSVRTTLEAVQRFSGLDVVPPRPVRRAADKETQAAMKELAASGYAVG